MRTAPHRLVRRAAFGSACAGLLLVAACSPEQPKEFSGAEGDVAAVIEKFGANARNEKSGAICRDQLTPALAKELAARAGGSCANAVAQAIRGADYLDVSVQTVTFTGEAKTARAATVRATVPDTEKRKRTLYIGLTRTDGQRDWQIADLAAPRPSAAKSTTP